jgi:hypothetical protein
MVCGYLIQSHASPAQVLRLVRTLREGSPRAPILVVHDATRCVLEEAPFRALGGVDLLQRRTPVLRGDFSMLDALFEGIARLLGEGPARPALGFDWLAYLSGQDYPVRPLGEFEESLERSRLDGFLCWWDAVGPDPRRPWRPRQGEDRYLCQYRGLPGFLGPPLRPLRLLGRATPLRLHLTYGVRLGWKPRRNPFGPSFRCFGGRQWWTLSRPCVEHLARFARERPDIVRWYRRTLVPDESFVQTALLNAGRFRLDPDDRRYIDFRGARDGRPRVLGPEDLPLLASGRWDFARKFDADRDPEVLDRLDVLVLGRRAGISPAPR